MDELSSIVEALAILSTVYKQNEDLWSRFRDDVFSASEAVEMWSVRVAEAPQLESHSFAAEPWLRVAELTIGDQVETSAEAELALSLMRLGVGPEDMADWMAGIEQVAGKNARVQAKLDLLLALASRSSSQALGFAEDFFDRAREMNDGFRLRVTGALHLGPRAAVSAEFATLLAAERASLLEDFLVKVRAATQGDDFDLLTWEDLSQDVYSTGLLPLFEEANGQLPERLLAALAEIHYRRGLAKQVGLELAYGHANFRYLGFWAGREEIGSQLRELFRRKQTAVAERFGLREWEVSGL